MASTVEEVEMAVAQLPQDQLRQFRAWCKSLIPMHRMSK